MAKKFNKKTKRDIINAYRNFATSKLGNISAADHIYFANTIINGKRQNANQLFDWISETTDVPDWFTKASMINLIRRAVGKGSVTEAASKEAMTMFHEWKHSSLSRSKELKSIVTRSKFEGVRSDPPTTVPKQTVVPPATRVPKPKSTQNTVDIIHQALANTKFSATELLTAKYTIPEFLQRIGVEVK